MTIIVGSSMFLFVCIWMSFLVGVLPLVGVVPLGEFVPLFEVAEVIVDSVTLYSGMSLVVNMVDRPSSPGGSGTKSDSSSSRGLLSKSGLGTRPVPKLGPKLTVPDESSMAGVLTGSGGRPLESDVADATFRTLVRVLDTLDKGKTAKIPWLDDYSDPLVLEVASVVKKCLEAYYSRLAYVGDKLDSREYRARYMARYGSKYVEKTGKKGALAIAKKSSSLAAKRVRSD